MRYSSVVNTTVNSATKSAVIFFMLDIYGYSLSFEELLFLFVAAMVTTYVHVIYDPYTFADVIAEERWHVIFWVFVLHLVFLSLWVIF